MGFTVYWSRQPVLHDVFERFKVLLPDLLEHSTVQETVSEVILVPTRDEESPERFWVRESASGLAFAKTSRAPYTTDVMRACILMVELKMARLEHLLNDDEVAFPWLEQLEAVHRHIPLTSYEEQARHFVKKGVDAFLESVPLKDQVEAVKRIVNSLRGV